MEVIKCPICNKEFSDDKKLKAHIYRCKNPSHELLKDLIDKEPNLSIIEIFNNNKDLFIEFLPKPKYKTRLVDDLKCPVCEKVFLEHSKLMTHIVNSKKSESHLLLSKLMDEDTESSLEVIFNNNKTSFDNLIKSKENKYPVKELMTYFYTKIDGKCSNFPKEVRQINYLFKNNITEEEIRQTMDYLCEIKKNDLSYLNCSIGDAKLFFKYKSQIKVEGTPAFLYRKLRLGNGLKVEKTRFVRDVEKIREFTEVDSSYKEMEEVIDYMISKNCSNIGFMYNMRDQYLVNKNSILAAKNSSNPSFNDRSEEEYIKTKLISGEFSTRKEKDQNKLKLAKEVGRELFMRNQYSNKFNPFEWVYKVGLEMDKDMYELALINKNSKLNIDEYIDRSPKGSIDKLKDIKNDIINFMEDCNRKYS